MNAPFFTLPNYAPDRQVPRLKSKRKTPVTIIIGVVCKGAIVLASDSQTTRGNMKRTDAEKITFLKFSQDRVLVAMAGNAGNCARAIEILREMAKDKDISDYRTPADLARLAMIKVKQELREQYCNCTMEQLQDFIWKDDLQAELMLAYYFDKKPYIFTLDLAVGRADKENSHRAAIGCGANLGSYLLSEHTKPGMTPGLVSVIAGYIIETVCKHDAACSPPAWVGVLINNIVEVGGVEMPDKIHPSAYGVSMIEIRSASAAPSVAETFAKIMDSDKQRRNKKIELLLSKQTKKGLAELNALISSPSLESFGPKRFSALKKRLAPSVLEVFKPSASRESDETK